MSMRNITLVGAVVLFLSGGLAFGGDGYFDQTAGSRTITGPAPGPMVVLASVSVPAGNYLITARVNAWSYAPNSGAVCFFTGPTVSTAWNYETLDTSSNWTFAKASAVMLSKFASTGNSNTVTLSCQKGYNFTGDAEANGTLMLVSVDSLN